MILHELRPKWKNKIAEVTWGLRRLHVNFEKAVSGSDPLQGSDKYRAGRQQYFCWSASVKRYKRLHSHGEH